MRISDWSSDVCSADLAPRGGLLMPDLMLLEPGTAYSLWAPSYPPRAHNPVMQAEERAMLALMPDTLHGKTVLDAGCGSGRYMLHALTGRPARGGRVRSAGRRGGEGCGSPVRTRWAPE